MKEIPTNYDQTAKTSLFPVWVEDYRKLNFNDKSEFTNRFLKQEFGEKKKKYRRRALQSWIVNPSTTLTEVATWCTEELQKMHLKIKALYVRKSSNLET
ncbi:hypothetical protein C5O19_09530 [Siphonobacter curvatus]|uniref:Uncharacterized protein n=1 Tax=Siphonobacter curvatus TaxID=2094562 RepID=A0A2S7IQ79_9BACT|nr:hypothetical protein C5O19_09530 [Siphonobacter curvatus]